VEPISSTSSAEGALEAGAQTRKNPASGVRRPTGQTPRASPAARRVPDVSASDGETRQKGHHGVGVTAAMPTDRLKKFEAALPERYYDVGIAEEPR